MFTTRGERRSGLGPRGRALLGLGVALLLFAVPAAADTLSRVGQGAQPGAGSDLVQGPSIVQGPCGGNGVQSTTEDLSKSLPYQLLTPSTDAAGPDNLVGAWQCGQGDQIALDYSSGISVLEDVNGIRDPNASWLAEAEQDSSTISVGEINGTSALFIDPAKSKGGAKGSITLVLGDIWLVVVGNGKEPLSTLIDVADSLTNSALAG